MKYLNILLLIVSSSITFAETQEKNKIFEEIDYYFTVKSNHSQIEFKEKFEKRFRLRYAKDKELIEQLKNLLEQTAHDVDTIPIRSKSIRFLGEIPSRESIRILGDLMLIDCTDLVYQGMDPKPSEMTEGELQKFINNDASNYSFRNDKFAASTLGRMKIKGFPIGSRGGLNRHSFKAAKEWYRNNRHRLDEVVRENWGDEWLESITPKKEPKRAIETKPEGELLTTKKRPVRTPPQEAEAKPQEQSSNWVLILIFTPLAALIGFLVYHRKN